MEDKAMAAFPCPMSAQSYSNQDCAPFQSGMTLRDYFAAKATEEDIKANAKFGESWGDSSDRALARYRHADAMLLAREST